MEFDSSPDGFYDAHRPEYLCVRMNGSSKSKEIKVKLSKSTKTVQQYIIEDIIKKHMSKEKKKSYPNAILYSKTGIPLGEDEILYLETGDVVFFSRHGEPFDWQQIMDKYEMIQKLGEGGFGQVFLMRNKDLPENHQDSLVAVKFLKLDEFTSRADGVYEIDRESKTLRMLNSKYIIQLLNYFIHGKNVILVMEYAKGGELKQYVNELGRLSENETRLIIKQIMYGLLTCHEKGIIHRDLKMENVLFTNTDHKQIKIVDFGIAGFCKNFLKEKTNAGTLKYMAPEVLNGDVSLANPAMDLWSLGMMMFQMLFGFHPFLSPKQRYSKDYELKDLINSIINDPLSIPQPLYAQLRPPETEYVSRYEEETKEPELPIISDEAKDLLNNLLNKNPRERISLTEAMRHEWLMMEEEDIEKNQALIKQRIIDQHNEKQLAPKKKKQLLHQNKSSVGSAFSQKQNNFLKAPNSRSKKSLVSGLGLGSKMKEEMKGSKIGLNKKGLKLNTKLEIKPDHMISVSPRPVSKKLIDHRDL